MDFDSDPNAVSPFFTVIHEGKEVFIQNAHILPGVMTVREWRRIQKRKEEAQGKVKVAKKE